MPRTTVRYQRQPDPVSQAQKQAASQAVQQRQAQTSAYAAAKFQEWAAGAQQREALMNARLQQAQSQAQLAGAQFRHNLWKENELTNQVTHYYNSMPAFQETLKLAGIEPGSARYRAEMMAFAATIPMARVHDPQIAKELADLSKVDDDQARLVNNIKTQRAAEAAAMDLTPDQFNQQFKVKGVVTGPKGHTTYESTRDIPQAALMRYGKLVGDIEEYGDAAQTPDKARVSAAQKEKSVFEAKYPDLVKLAPQATPTPTPEASGLNPLQKGLIAIGLGKAPATPSPTPEVPAVTQQPSIRRYNPQTGELE